MNIQTVTIDKGLRLQALQKAKLDIVNAVVRELERVNDSLEFDECLKVSERRRLYKQFQELKARYNDLVGVKFQPITKWDRSKHRFVEVEKSRFHTKDCPCPQCINSDLPIPNLRQR